MAKETCHADAEIGFRVRTVLTVGTEIVILIDEGEIHSLDLRKPMILSI